MRRLFEDECPPEEQVWASIRDGAVEVTGIITYDVVRESNYGADADGNRGMPMTFHENPRVVTDSVQVVVYKDAGETFISYERLSKRNQERVELLLMDAWS